MILDFNVTCTVCWATCPAACFDPQKVLQFLRAMLDAFEDSISLEQEEVIFATHTVDDLWSLLGGCRASECAAIMEELLAICEQVQQSRSVQPPTASCCGSALWQLIS